MRLKSATVRNYRILQDFRVEFDPQRTVIGGSNETGKSTMAEAVHRALFLRAKMGGAQQKALAARENAGHPEVQVCFSAGGQDFVVEKKFAGATGTTLLRQVGGETWRNEQAEERLAELLRVEEAGGGRGGANLAAQQWAHLWVWQGKAGEDPSIHASAQKRGLLQRLQELGGAAVLQSERDAEVAARFAQAKEEMFTQAGRPKAGSELAVAEENLQDRMEKRNAASQRLDRLRGAVEEFENASQIIVRSADDLDALERQRQVVEEKLEQAAQLSRRMDAEDAQARQAAENLQSLLTVEKKMDSLTQQTQNLRRDLAPRRAEAERLAVRFESDRAGAAEALRAFDTAANVSREARLRRDLAAAAVALFDREAALRECRQRDAAVRELDAALAKLRAELAALSPLGAKDFQALQKLEAEAKEAAAALNAMAAEIEVVSAEEDVRVGDSPMTPGSRQLVSEPVEIRVGESARLRIAPGGGANLQEAGARLQDRRQKLQKRFDALGLAGIAEAAALLARRDDLTAKISNVEAKMDGMGAGGLSGALAAAEEAFAAAQADVARRAAQCAGADVPTSADEATRWLREQRSAAEASEAQEKSSLNVRDARNAAVAQAEELLTKQRRDLQKQEDELLAAEAQLDLLRSTHGDDAARAAAVRLARESSDGAAERLRATRRALEDLQPDVLTNDRSRLARAIQQCQEIRQEAEKAQAVARAALQSDGSEDPAEALALADAEAQDAQENRARIRRHAEAIRLLDELFTREQHAMAEAFTRPFAESISGYLQCLFGPGARASIILHENDFSGLELIRPQSNAGAPEPFEGLSGGAREQVAAAVRLAMAEVLAADHGGCLPVVFDDAFAYADDKRVSHVQRMLDLAASRGLQIIVLTCNPSDYTALGAKMIEMKPRTQALSKSQA